MSNDIEQPKSPRNGKALAGIILLGLGMVLLLQQFRFIFIPADIELWPLWLVVAGLFIGSRSNFRKPSSLVLIILGVIFLIGANIDDSSRFMWPLGIIAFGLWMILRRHSSFSNDYWSKKNENKWDWRNYTNTNQAEPIVDYTEVPPVDPAAGPASTNSSSSSYRGTGDDYLDTVSVFGGVKKIILSKDFKGGEVVNIFGGAELDFIQAEIYGNVVIDITQIFGSTKIIVPSHWRVVTDVAAVFAGIDDKRIKNTSSPNNEKILVIKGVSIFAGVDIRSY